MTDIEKLFDLYHCKESKCKDLKDGECTANICNVRSIGIKMAEWKEQQMIERAVEWLRANAGKYIKGCLSTSNYCTEHCIDDFKEAMSNNNKGIQ